MEPSRTKTFLGNSFLMFLSLGLFWAVLELIFGQLIEKPQITAAVIPSEESKPPEERMTFHQYHPILGFEGKPNVEKNFWHHDIKQNSRGERGPEIPYERTAENLRIALIGDSGTWGFPLADSETLGSYLTSDLQSRGISKSPEIVNLGVIGYSADQELLSYILKGTKYKPDFVVVDFFSGNDLWELMTDSAWGVFKPRMILEQDELCLSDIPVTKASGWPEVNLGEVFGIGENKSEIFRESNVFKFFRSREFKGGIRNFFSTPSITNELENTEMVKYLKEYLPCVKFDQLPTPNYADYIKRDDQAIELYLRIMSLFKKLVEESGAKLIVTLIPSTESYAGANLSYMRVKSGLKELGIDAVDLDQLGHLNGLKEEELFTYAHQTGAGNKLLSKEISDWISVEFKGSR